MAERAIRITAGTVSAQAKLNDSKTARAIWDALPIEAKAQTWGDEIYFAIGVSEAEDSARETVELGDLGYWPPGHAFCIFFGPTPASPVNVVGRVAGDARAFTRVRSGARVVLERA